MVRKSNVERTHKASVPGARPSKPLSGAVVSKLGKIADTELARLFSLELAIVRQERQRLEIPPFGRVNWTPDKIKLLGSMSDKKVARKLGVVATTIYSKRMRLVIPAFGPSFQEARHVWSAREIKRLGTIPDADSQRCSE